MPELPEVEGFRRYLDSTSLHQQIAKVEVLGEDILTGISGELLRSRLEGRHLENTMRHGKYAFAQLDGDAGWLAFHFGMTGYLSHFQEASEVPPYSRLLIHFSNGSHLAYVCMRKLGRVRLIEDVEIFAKAQRLGPDALDSGFDFDAFKKAIGRTKSPLKAALMNQKLLAGVGNIYSDEALFRARIHPRTTAEQLSDRKLRELFLATKEVLQKAIGCEATPGQIGDSYVLPRGQRDGVCPRCGASIKHQKFSGRTAYFCPRCQKARN